jgi:hypothetical protein
MEPGDARVGWFRALLLVVSLLAAPMASMAAAQQRQASSLELAAGWVGFADDGIVNEALIGGAARWNLGPRLSIGPEVVYIDGNGHSHLVLTGNLTFELLAPRNGRVARVTPFLVVGGGVFQTRESFPSGTFTSREGAFTAGGGVRTSVGRRVTAGVDARIGWELHLRVSGFVGLVFAR